MIIVFGVAGVPLLRLLPSIGDFCSIVRRMWTVRGIWDHLQGRTKHLLASMDPVEISDHSFWCVGSAPLATTSFNWRVLQYRPSYMDCKRYLGTLARTNQVSVGLDGPGFDE